MLKHQKKRDFYTNERKKICLGDIIFNISS